MESDIEYIQLFMAYESDDMPVIYFYEVDLKDNRFVLREMEVFADRTVKIENDFYRDVIEVCSIPTVDEFNAKVWGEGFYATIISKEEFDELWNTGIYNGSLTAIMAGVWMRSRFQFICLTESLKILILVCK